MRIKAGKYTLALTMILCGLLMLVNTFYGQGIFKDLWLYSPAVLILFGLEIIFLNLIFGARESYKVEVSVGSIILVIFVIALFMVWMHGIDIWRPFIQDPFKFEIDL
ncbi:MAG: hypothetical protein N2484_08085 [Clostridia bacterium]|nr:hypothetical protein [Clostridia bacterium]